MRVEGFGTGGAPVALTFDGRRIEGRAGEPLAASLMGAGIRLVGRSFKYHRPRGVLTAGSEEPNALVTVTRGADRDPNVRATMQEVYDGLEAVSQNRWPNLDWDLMAINDRAWPFLGAGFYYKTFMWPRAFWEKLYEPVIRRAAGLGALSGAANGDVYEKAYAFCDVLVIGAGPTGLAAALTAGRSGARVILADEGAAPGGRFLSDREQLADRAEADWIAEVVGELESLPNVRIMTRTTVTGAYDGGTYGALERVGHHLAPRADLPLECFWRIVAKRTVLAAGALERPLAFSNNDRPGILLASALRSYVTRWGVAPGRRVAIFANNDDGHTTARAMQAAGLEVVGVIDARQDAPDSADFPVYKAGRVLDTEGRLGLKKLQISHAGGQRSMAVDALAMAGGWSPSVHLTCHMNGRPTWDPDLAAFVPTPGAVPGLEAAGAAAGHFAAADCLVDGVRAAGAALSDLQLAVPDVVLPDAARPTYDVFPLWSVEGGPKRARAWLDFQNDVTTKDVKLAAQEGMVSVEHMKRYTTQGMATDQGKSSNVNALAVLADATGRGIPETGTTTFRPPYVPVAIAAYGAGAEGMGFAPERRTTSDAATRERGAPMIEAGMWFRPSYFPRAGERTWRDSCDREVRMVRDTVGVCDVSTLGKIDVQGPDAGAFLDFIYTNMMSSLPVGKVRYGLMLREDGHVMDDGTCARLAQDHFVITTTTVAAGQVMAHVDFVLQALRPELKVRAISTTEQWAQFAVAGPRSRRLIDSLIDTPLAEDFPFMGCAPVSVMGVFGRLFRISFSGEHAYEIAVPSRYGDALFRMLVSQAEALGGGAYGMEALNVMRIEKGFPTHAELHGRTTAFDIGLPKMMSQKKDFIGRAAAGRPGLTDPGRQQLVGLRAVDPGAAFVAGAHLYAPDAPVAQANDQGYLTSVCYSPTLDTHLALGFLDRGPERVGETLRAECAMRGVATLCEVVHPVFFDPEGGRMRG